MSRLEQVPIAACEDWDALLAALQAQPGGERLAALPGTLSRAVLAAPAAMARWMAERAPQLTAKRELDILVAGAERLDAVDQGRWYQWVPALLGAPLDVHITLVGDRLDRERASPVRAHAPQAPAHLYQGALADYLDRGTTAEHDLVFLFHPGFQKHRGWLRDASITRLIAAGSTIVAAAYELDESEVDRWVVECHGFSSHGEPLLNPFFLDFSEAGSSLLWGRALWRFGDRVPSPGTAVDHARLARLDQLTRMVMHSIALGYKPIAPYGSEVVLNASNGTSRKLVYLFDEYFVDPEQAMILALRQGRLDALARLLPGMLAGRPGIGATELERAVWAGGIKAQHLMAYYTRLPDETTDYTLARAMHADLAQKVDALLQINPNPS